MGCVSSKIMTRSGSFNEEVKHSLQRVNGFEELITSKNGGDQFLALICTANTVARKLKASNSAAIEPEEHTEASLNRENPKIVNTEDPDHNTNPSVELAEVVTINTWELLAGLEEDNGQELQPNPHQQTMEETSTTCFHSTSFRMTEEYKLIVNNDSTPSKTFNSDNENHENGVVRSRSLRTVEEFDAMVGRIHSPEEGKHSTEDSESSINECTTNSEREPKIIDKRASDELESNRPSEKSSRRKAMAKELGVLKVPGFEFSKSGSLRDWLQQGGQVCSPGSYVTPKFGNFVSPRIEDGDTGCDGAAVFDPEMVFHFEQAMKQLTVEEECILKEIVDSLEGGNEGGISRIAGTEEHIQR